MRKKKTVAPKNTAHVLTNPPAVPAGMKKKTANKSALMKKKTKKAY